MKRYPRISRWLRKPAVQKGETREYLTSEERQISFPRSNAFEVLKENDIETGILYPEKLSVKSEDRYAHICKATGLPTTHSS